MNSFVGKYIFSEFIGLDNYLQYLGVGVIYRKVQSVSRPTFTFLHDERDNHWVLRLTSVFHSYEIRFKLNEKVEDETLDARPCMTTVTYDKNEGCIVFKQTTEEGPHVKILIHKIDNTIRMNYIADAHSCYFIFKNENE